MHAHVFTHHHVPPFLAKTIVVWPLYYFIHVPTFVRFYKIYLRFNNQRFRLRMRRRMALIHQVKFKINRTIFGRFVYAIFITWLGLTAFYILFYAMLSAPVEASNYGFVVNQMLSLGSWLTNHGVLFSRPSYMPSALNIGLALLIFIFVKSVRKLIIFGINQVRSFVHLLPGKQSKELYERYLLMARYATYGQQYSIYSRLKRQYPLHTNFAILPMDMDFAGAGKVDRNHDYYQQMEDLIRLNKKKEVHAFVFVDPRRIRRDGKSFFDFEIINHKVILKPSFIKRFIEEEGFAGFKIYPALGYFPFDEDLLPLWKYAADNGIPIMSHGIKGIIYYRGILEKEWLRHPVFTEHAGKGKKEPMQFKQFKNADFQVNFTHPLNFLCLLEEPLLRKLIGEGKNQRNKEIFGYTDEHTPLQFNLSHLKVCYAHFGGAEEWQKYLSRDRDNYAQQLMAKPHSGIYFGPSKHGVLPWGRYENVWRHTDWYSIICSLMIQYPNFYADISYIVSEPKLYPLLRSSLSEGRHFENQLMNGLAYEARNKLRSRVLFGSDFYVVRSQKSDKDIFTELRSFLSEEEFDLIARENPHNYMQKRT